MKEYFIFTIEFKNKIPKFLIKLNLSLFPKKDKPYFVSKSNKKMPLTSSSILYFEHYAEDKELAKKLFNYRKKYFNQYCVYQEMYEQIDDAQRKTIDNYFLSIKKKERENHAISIQSETYVNKLKVAAQKNKHKRSKRMKKMYQQEERRNILIGNLHSEDSKKKRIESFMKTMSTQDVKKSFLESLRKRDIEMKRSGVRKRRWLNMSDSEKSKIIQNLRYKKSCELNGIKMNFNEYIVGSILDDLKLQWKYETPIKIGDRHLFPDFIIESHKLIIECYGTYWHADPEIFCAEDIFFKKMSAEEIWKKDYDRIKNFDELGYNVLILWERTIHSDPESVKKLILRRIT